MKLRTALTLILGFTVLTLIAMSVALIRMTDLLEREALDLVSAAESVRAAEELESTLLFHNRQAFLHVVENEDLKMQTREPLKASTAELLGISDTTLSPKEKDAVREVAQSINAYLAMRDELDNSTEPLIDQYRQIAKSIDQALAAVRKLVEINLEESQAIQATVQRQNLLANRMGYGLIIFAGIISLCLMFGTMIAIYRPLKNLRRVISRYGDGDTSVRARIEGLHETREMASTFNSMADQLESRRQDQLRFIASIAHDLRNPLSSMSMASELLLSDFEKSQSRGLSKIIHRQVKHLDRLVGDLLDTTRIEAGTLELERIECDVRSYILDSVELYRNYSDRHKIEVDLPDSPLICECDPGRLTQVFNNLISNAIKYSPNGGQVLIKAWRDVDSVSISIADEGIGIPENEVEKIFHPFNRTQKTRDTIPGIGLGLSASKRIVQAHGGVIQVSTKPGRGSIFKVKLPALDLSTKKSAATTEPQAAENPLQVDLG